MEMKYTFKLVTELLKSKRIIAGEEYIERLSNCCERASNNNFQLYGIANYFHIFSLSYNPDSLTLWSAYSCLDGYNIGLSKKVLFDLLGNLEQINILEGYSIGKVIYSETKQKDILKRVIENGYNAWKETNNDTVLNEVLVDLILQSEFFKSPKFEHEEEYRIAFSLKNESYFSSIDFINASESLKPFFKLKFHDRSLISSITIGPKNNQDIASSGVRLFLDKYKYENIEIKKSSITLRY